MSENRFLRVKDGSWVDKDDNTIYLVGANYWPPALPYEEEFYGQEINEHDIVMYKKFGFTAMRVGINWRYLEKEKGKYDDSYTEIIKTVRDWCKKYSLYYIVDLHLTQIATTPVWMKDFDYISGSDGFEHFLKTWKFITSLFVDEEFCVGYEVPGNEVGDRVTGGLFIGNYMEEFEEWLAERYSAEPRKLRRRWYENGEFNRDNALKSHWTNNGLTDRNDFYSYNLMKMVKATVDAIRDVDPNHLFILQNAQGYGPGIMAYKINYTDLSPIGVSGSGDHLYSAYWNNGRTSGDLPSLSTKAYPVAHFSSFMLSGMATYNGETSSNVEESAKWEFEMYSAQLYRLGVGGMLWWAWRRDDNERDFDMLCKDWSLKPQAASMPMFARAWKYGKPKRIEPQVAIVCDTVADDEPDNYLSLLGLGDILGGLHVDYTYLPAAFVAEHPECLNRYRAVIAGQGRMRNSARKILSEFGKSGGKLLLLGACLMDEYRESDIDCSVYESLIVAPGKGAELCNRIGDMTEQSCAAVRDYGEISAGYRMDSPISDWCLAPLSEESLPFDSEIVLVDLQTGKCVMWKCQNTSVYCDWLKPVLSNDKSFLQEKEKHYLPGELIEEQLRDRSWVFINIERFRKIVKSFCIDSGVEIDARTPESIIYAYNETGYILLENSPCMAYENESVQGEVEIWLDAARLGLHEGCICSIYDETIEGEKRPVSENIIVTEGKLRFVIELDRYDIRLLKVDIQNK